MFGYQFDTNRKENFQEWRKQSGRSSSAGEAWSNASNTPFRMHKRWVHEGGIATPLIVHWPNRIRSGGGLSAQPGHVIDVLATCIDVADTPYPQMFSGHDIKATPGVSLLPAIQSPHTQQLRTLFWEHETHAAIRQGNWKLVTLNATNLDAWELYDLTKVRTETNDLAKQAPQRVRQLREQWTQWAEQANVLPWPKQRQKKK